MTANDYKDPVIVAYVYDARGNGEGGVVPTITGDHNGHLNDYMAVLVLGNTASNAVIAEDGTSPTLLGTRGGTEKCRFCWAVDSHPEDSRMQIAGDVSPSLTVKIAKGSCDGPLVLIRRET